MPVYKEQKLAKQVVKELDSVIDKFTDDIDDKEQMMDIGFKLISALSKVGSAVGNKKQFLANVGAILMVDNMNEAFED